MKKYLFIFAIFALGLTLNACKDTSTTTTTAATTTTVASTTTTAAQTGNFNYPDGKYFAAGTEFESGYRYWVVVTVASHEITDLVWDGYNIDGGAGKCVGEDKLTCAADGKYGLNNEVTPGVQVKDGTWDVQSEAATQWIVDNQSLTTTFTDGVADAISSVSVSTSELFTLVQTALDAGAVAHGDYAKDGYFYEATTTSPKAYAYRTGTVDGAEITGTFDSYTFGTFVIVNGTLVIADFNATQTCYQYVLTSADADATKSANWLTGNAITVGTGDDAVTTATPYVVAVKADGTPLLKFVTKDVAQHWYGMNWAGEAVAAETKLLADQSLTISDAGIIDGVASVSMAHSAEAFDTILDSLTADMNS